MSDSKNQTRLFAIGDIHGCVAELEVLLSSLELQAGLTPADEVVFIGDYIDRGPDSMRVIELLLDFSERFPNTRFLRGNHEEMLLDFLELGGAGGAMFIHNGGEDTLNSYGFTYPFDPDEIRAHLPPKHLAFFQKLERLIPIGEVLFAHAGVDPLRDLASQTDDDLFWIREPFINNIHHFGVTVVFGHTPFKDIHLHLPYKIGIDTGLVYGNKLCALELSSLQCTEVKAGARRAKIRQLKQGKGPSRRLY